jgi:hypothetical protein
MLRPRGLVRHWAKVLEQKSDFRQLQKCSFREDQGTHKDNSTALLIGLLVELKTANSTHGLCDQ